MGSWRLSPAKDLTDICEVKSGTRTAKLPSPGDGSDLEIEGMFALGPQTSRLQSDSGSYLHHRSEIPGGRQERRFYSSGSRPPPADPGFDPFSLNDATLPSERNSNGSRNPIFIGALFCRLLTCHLQGSARSRGQGSSFPTSQTQLSMCTWPVLLEETEARRMDCIFITVVPGVPDNEAHLHFAK
ncbi:Pyridine Nucleotide-Disulfide Oxidoreductase Domain-Containing Protein 1 [Manis pentadactyla]|nr:Pyridine Nucleotide-Disulfide Oxidoreductase Domain-Containing Protein 1 [Manis pentadactyla]